MLTELDMFWMQIIYVEACESGSIFEGIMPTDINTYVTTASNAQESSWGTYCPGMEPPPPPEFITCLGDLYSVAWMEDRWVFINRTSAHWNREQKLAAYNTKNSRASMIRIVQENSIIGVAVYNLATSTLDSIFITQKYCIKIFSSNILPCIILQRYEKEIENQVNLWSSNND